MRYQAGHALQQAAQLRAATISSRMRSMQNEIHRTCHVKAQWSTRACRAAQCAAKGALVKAPRGLYIVHGECQVERRHARSLIVVRFTLSCVVHLGRPDQPSLCLVLAWAAPQAVAGAAAARAAQRLPALHVRLAVFKFCQEAG